MMPPKRNCSVPNSSPYSVLSPLFFGSGEEEFVYSFDKAGGIIELPPFGQQGLIEQDMAPVSKVRLFVFKALDHGMIRIDFQDRLGWLTFCPADFSMRSRLPLIPY